MNYFEQAKDWTKLWSNPQTNLFQSWIEGKGHSPFPARKYPLGRGGRAGVASDERAHQALRWKAGRPSPRQVRRSRADKPHSTRGPSPGCSTRRNGTRRWRRGPICLSSASPKGRPTRPRPISIASSSERRSCGFSGRRTSRAIWAVVQGAWNRAFEQFTQALGTPDAAPLKSWRAVLDLWLSIANDALLGLHHRPEFLEAQRRMTRSAAEYRLQERELAEVFLRGESHPDPYRDG